MGQDVESAIDLSLMFEHGLHFEDSKNRAGLQLVDAVAHIVRRAVLEPDEERVQDAYDALRPKLRNGKGESLTIHRLRVAGKRIGRRLTATARSMAPLVRHD